MEKVVRVFDTFEAADAADAFSRAQMTPQQRPAYSSNCESERTPLPLSSDLREYIECLNLNEVEYLVVGALAVSWHEFPRYSADNDGPPYGTESRRVLLGLYPARSGA